MIRRIGFTQPSAWSGGFYELELVDPPLDATLRALDTVPELDGWFARRDAEPEERDRESATSLLEHDGNLYGWLSLHDGTRVPCRLVTCGADPAEFLTLLLPLGGLGGALPVEAFPFDDMDPHESWRRPLESRLRDLAETLFESAPFRLAIIGFEIDPGAEAPSTVRADHRENAYLVPSANGLEWRPRTLP